MIQNVDLFLISRITDIKFLSIIIYSLDTVKDVYFSLRLLHFVTAKKKKKNVPNIHSYKYVLF